MYVRLLAVLFCFGVSLPAPRAQDSVGATDPGSIALRLQTRQRTAGIDYEAQLLAAERAYARGDFGAAAARLDALAERTFLDSRAIELTYRVLRATGRDSAAVATLREGLSTYPHAVRLLRINPMEAALRDELTAEEVATDRRFTDALRAELNAVLAFRQNRSATALLEAERASYLYDGRNELAASTKQAVAEVYAHALSRKPDTTLLPIAAPDLSFDEAYGRAFAQAAARLQTGGGLDSTGQLEQVAKLRAVTLRLFVREGGLGRWPDPMLLDLYVLDRAGHLETTTMLQLAWLAPEEALALERTQPARVGRARRYMREDWREAADAYGR